MSLRTIPNQPVQFDVNPEYCSVGQLQYKQLLDITDTTQVQFEITPCLFNSNNIINGGFTNESAWITTGSFEVDPVNNQACKESGGIGTLQQYNIFLEGYYYQLEIYVSSANEQMQVWNGATQLGNITGIGNFKFSFQATGDSLSIRSFSTTASACITSISSYQLDDRIIVAILQEDGTFVDSFRFADNPEYFNLSLDKLTVSIVWSDFLAEEDTGCYYLGIADPCINTNGQNGIFNPNMLANGDMDAGGFDVTVGSAAQLVFGDYSYGAFYRATATGATGTVTISDPYSQFTTGVSYDYAIQFSAVSGSNSANINIDFGGTSDNNVAAVGSLVSGTIVCGAGNAFTITLDPVVTPVVLFIESIIVTLTNDSDFEPDYESVGFKRGAFDCSVLINSNCNEDGMGFEFEQSLFNPRLRVEGELINPTYPSERVVIEDTRGNRNTIYGERAKSRTLKLDLQPEYILDYLSSLPIVDNLWIDGVKYSVEEDQLEPDYPNEVVGHGKISMVLLINGDKIYNRNVIGIENDNQAVFDFSICDPKDINLLITEPTTGDTIKAL